MSITFFFIVEPPHYQNMACYLASSIRTFAEGDVRLVGYCPAHRYAEIDRDVMDALRVMNCEVRPFEAEGRFATAYPHGNKILAALEPRDTAFSAFLDSDVLMIRPQQVDRLCIPGAVAASPAASMYWAQRDIWDLIYGAFGMPLPEERIYLMRQKNRQRLPYYSSGFVVFPEQFRTEDGLSFPEVWMQTAQIVDQIDGLENKRPYLDQMSLPVAIKRAGLSWHELMERQHYILGGILRGKPFPEDEDITLVHYRSWEILTENGLSDIGYTCLKKQIGSRRISGIRKRRDRP